jgi:lysophospholipase L1-like esterase
LICAALCASSGFGQSLSVVKKAETNYWVEATAPANTPYALQASENLHLWVGLQDELQGPYSARLEGTNILRRFFRVTSPPPPPPPHIRILMIGDSLTSDCCGWGQGIPQYFNANATVVNYAMAGESTKVFLKSAEMEKMLLIKPDYVLIQFGWVDEAWGAEIAPDVYTSPAEFEENLRTIVQTVRGFNGTPIIVNVHAARVWDANGKVIPSFSERNAINKKVSDELHTQMIDLNKLTTDVWNELGPGILDIMHMPSFPPNDVMHVSVLGATVIARVVVNALPDNLGPYLKGGMFDKPVIPIP